MPRPVPRERAGARWRPQSPSRGTASAESGDEAARLVESAVLEDSERAAAIYEARAVQNPEASTRASAPRARSPR